MRKLDGRPVDVGDVLGKMVCRVRDHVIHHEGTTALPQDRLRHLLVLGMGMSGTVLALLGDNELDITHLTQGQAQGKSSVLWHQPQPDMEGVAVPAAVAAR